MFSIRTLDSLPDGRWDAFAARHPSGVVYHRSAWAKVIEATYGHTPFYVVLEDSGTGEIAGAAPFFIVRSPLTGDRVVSLPFATFCDPLVPPAEMQKVAAFIFERVPKAGHIKLKLLDFKMKPLHGMQFSRSYVTHFIDLHPSLDQLFGSFHVSSVRQRIRRAERNGVVFRLGRDEEDLRAFYRLHTGVRRRHGLPPQPYSFFKNMWTILGRSGLLDLAVVEHAGRVVAASIILKSGELHHHEYSASDENSWKLCSNQKLLWEIIQMARAQGARYLDLGRSEVSNATLIEYKERWQGKRRPLAYGAWPARSLEVSAAGKEKNGDGLLKHCLGMLNRHLPGALLELEGRLIYPHRD